MRQKKQLSNEKQLKQALEAMTNERDNVTIQLAQVQNELARKMQEKAEPGRVFIQVAGSTKQEFDVYPDEKLSVNVSANSLTSTLQKVV